MKPEYKISKDKLKSVVDLTDPNILIKGYECPIRIEAQQLSRIAIKKMDDNIFEAVLREEIVVERDELLKALKYDRDQYEKGYRNGYACGIEATQPDVIDEFVKRFEFHLRNATFSLGQHFDIKYALKQATKEMKGATDEQAD